jgi:hypothetical protein
LKFRRLPYFVAVPMEHLVDEVAKILEQEAMAVIVAKASDGYLLFPDEA